MVPAAANAEGQNGRLKKDLDNFGLGRMIWWRAPSCGDGEPSLPE